MSLWNHLLVILIVIAGALVPFLCSALWVRSADVVDADCWCHHTVWVGVEVLGSEG